ncbi:MAG: hypothetical protein IK123_11555, partial [Lachnospiraceae bacterium]|nr:hypothetical protein [Lachnospiraceae bacterium]
MRTSDRGLVSIIIAAVMVVVSSAIMLSLFFRSELFYYQDIALRDDLAGSVDMYVIGSCQDKFAYVPAVMDEELSCVSYNLSGIHAPLYGQIALMEEEIERNPVKNIIIGADYDTLAYTSKGIKAIGDTKIIPRLRTPMERLRYFIKNIHIEDYDIIYSTYINGGLVCAKAYLTGQKLSGVPYDDRGHYTLPANDMSLAPGTEAEAYRTSSLETDIIEDNDKLLSDLIGLCKSKGANVMIVMTPSSDSYVWSYDGWDIVHSQIEQIAEENDIIFLDFNLYRTRNELLDDKTS